MVCMDEQAKRDTLARAREAVLRLLKFRFRSEKELWDKLKPKGFSPQTIAQVIQYFKDIDLVDDRQFARKWIFARLAKPFGSGRIRFELKEKGVDPEIIEEELKEAAKDYSEMDIVSELAQRRAAIYKGLAKEKIRQRLYGYLLRRGFNPQTVMKVIRKI